MIRIAMTLLGRGRWTGGENYLRNMLRVIAERASDRLHPVLFLTPEENAAVGGSLAPLLPQPPVVDPAVAAFGQGRGLQAALLTGVDRAAATAFAAHACDVVFEPALFYGWRFPLPTIAWLPDLQHRHMAHMFPRAGWLRREAGFRAQIASGRTVMVSSKTARGDVEHFYPAARGRAVVVRFAQAMDIAGNLARAAELRTSYDLPRRFVFLPNQFWKHKNHGIVGKMLALAQARSVLAEVPLIVMSGRQDDIRHPRAFGDFMARLASSGTADRVRHLGLIPYADVLGLIGAADAMLNPSLFEGWSTTVEEAKALGARLCVSDLSIHREQVPHADLFAPDDPAALLDALRAIAADPPHVPPPVDALVVANDARLAGYVAALEAAMTAALNGRDR